MPIESDHNALSNIFLIDFLNSYLHHMKSPKKHPNNIAYIDGQNLHLGTKSDGRTIDIHKFRIYLKDKYKVSVAYYFLGYVQDSNELLYTKLQEAWFVVIFKKQMIEMTSTKKWNIDSDMIFHIMAKLIDDWATWDKIILVSWDGDFKILIDYLIKKDRLHKIIFPNKKYASSLYNDLTNASFAYLSHNKKRLSHHFGSPKITKQKRGT